MTGIRTNISGNVLSSLSSVPASDDTLTIISLAVGMGGTSSKINRAKHILPVRQHIRNTCPSAPNTNQSHTTRGRGVGVYI